MGWHTCEYLSYDEAKTLNFRNIDAFHSSGDVTLGYASGRTWVMPDMARLYVEMGWVPPQAFIDDVMGGKVTATQRMQTRSVVMPERIGYLSPEKDPLPRPFRVSDKLPQGFLQKLELQMAQSEHGLKKSNDAGDNNNTPPKKNNGLRR